jgi:CBS domain containing-hemolysin-like protein
MGWLFVAALALILVAGWCAVAQGALLRVSRAGAKELSRSSGDASAPLQAVLAEIPASLSALLLTRIVASVAATVLMTSVLLHWIGYDWRAFLIATAAMTVLTYLATGLLPRVVGRHNAVRLASTAASLLYPVIRILRPLPGFLKAGSGTLGPDGEEPDGPSGSEEDLRGLVDLLERRRVIQPDERAMIHSVFELGDTIVREVMVPRTDMVFVERGKTLRQAVSLALRSGFSRIPVIGENLDDVVGIAYLKDIVTRSYEHRESESVEPVSSIMRPATFEPESKPINQLLREMQARQIHVAIVIDEYGGTAGLVTIEDILEEIVGEIADEYDKELPPVEWLGEGRARVTARLSVEELAELFDVRIDAEDVETVGGLLAQQLGRVPIAGSVATVAGLRLTAESLAGRRNRIGTVTVERIGAAKAGRDEPDAESGRPRDRQPDARSELEPAAGRPGAAGNGRPIGTVRAGDHAARTTRGEAPPAGARPDGASSRRAGSADAGPGGAGPGGAGSDSAGRGGAGSDGAGPAGAAPGDAGPGGTGASGAGQGGAASGGTAPGRA